MSVERQVYNGWAFTENEMDKAYVNKQIYDEITSRYRVLVTNRVYIDREDPADFDLLIGRTARYLHGEYLVVKNDTDLTLDELLLVCDRGNLCFGGSALGENLYRVSED